MDLKFYNVYKNTCSLLYERGYEKIEIPDFETFKNISRAQLTINTKSRENYKIRLDPINVYFSTDEKMGIKQLSVFIKDIEKCAIKNAIIVVNEITPFVNTEIVNISKTKSINVEIFTESELIMDITKHELVPKHELLTNDEKNKLFSDFKINETQLPKMLTSDPVSRYYGLKDGNVVRITRPSETGGTYITYKLVRG
jgi:DNA-directed RNA polymerase I, II, and III subunit RPABC1